MKSKFENMAREQEEVGSLFAFPAFALFTTFLSDVDEILKFLDVRRYSIYDPISQVKKPTNPNLPVRLFPP